MLQKYEISNLKYNFQKCSICMSFSTKLAKAKTSQERCAIKNDRCHHLQQCKAERVNYDVHKLEAAANFCLSLCLDGWSIWTTTAPHACVNSKDLDGMNGLQLKVTGAICHGGPSTQFISFYISDPSVAHDTNLNIEVIRRMLLKVEEKGGVIHDKIYIQTDNAGDNKSKHMFAFLMLLVKEGVASEVQLSMLIVGHTHIDIDQVFSIPSIHMRKMSRVKPLLQTPARMLDEWRDSFRNHPNGVPSMEFIHATRDVKTHVEKGAIDTMFAGYQGTRKAKASKRVNKKQKEAPATGGVEGGIEEAEDAHEHVETMQVKVCAVVGTVVLLLPLLAS